MSCFHGKRFGDFSVSKDLQSIVCILDDPVREQGFEIDDRAGFELVERRDVDDRELLCKVVFEPALRQPAVNRELAALEARTDAAARTRLLALWPRPAVFPLPLPAPLPFRKSDLTEPGAGESS